MKINYHFIILTACASALFMQMVYTPFNEHKRCTHTYKGVTTLEKETILLARETFAPHSFETLDQGDQKIYGESYYNNLIAWYHNIADAAFEKIMYNSDGLKVVGILGLPTPLMTSKKYPVIIYNRGGSGENGKITVKKIKDLLYPLVKCGYIVIGSQYRGNDGSQGKDELGGADVDDVINLFDVIKLLPNADLNNIFMLGFSRGAIDTYRALQMNKLPIKAAALISGVSDLFLFEKLRPDAIPLLQQFIPHYATNKIAEMTKRSAICWIQDINVPLLLMHGDADRIIDVSTTRALAEKLKKNHQTHKVIIYPGSNHFLDLHMKDAVHEICKWFDKYK